MTKQVFLILVLILSSFSLFAQKGSITGNVKDGKNGEALIGASVFVDGTTLGTVTDFDGNYTIPNVPAGTVTVKCSFISYETSTKENVAVTEGKSSVIDFIMGESTVALEDVKVVAKANRESEVVLLLDQKKSAVIKQSIGAQELSSQGVSDAATAATKITGVTKQEGTKGLNVRGLGDRYNSTSLNGLPLPSNNAEYKNIDLELFSTDIIEYVDVQKVSLSNISGDFAGANVNIVSKKHTGDPFFKVGVKAGYNSGVSDADKFYLSDGPGLFGFYNTNYPVVFNSYKFENKWNPEEKTVYPNSGLSLSGGKTFEFNNSKLNAFATVSFDNEYSYSELILRKINASNDIHKDLKGEEYTYKTQTTGLLNLNYNWTGNNIYLNSIFLNTSDNSLKNLKGHIKDLAENDAFVRRMEFERNTVIVNQLLGDHKLKSKSSLNWGVTYNMVTNIVPDRRHVTMENGKTKKFFATNDNANSNRYYHELTENEIAANFNLDFKFGESYNNSDYRGKLSVGYAGKYKTRSFESVQFNHKINKEKNKQTNIYDVDSYFNNENLQSELFYLKVLSNDFITKSTYDGKQLINSAYVNMTYNFSSKFLALIGVRVENVFQEIKFNTSIQKDKEDFTEFNILPNLSVKYALTDKANLRFATSISYTLPQFKESAPFLFEGITDVTVGNPYLTPSTNYNGEIKWEFFPKGNELFSVAMFGKYIIDPINKFIMASAGNEFTYANTGDWAHLYGLEFEIKKDIFSVSTATSNKKIYTTSNLTLMKTNQKLDKEKIIEQSNGKVNANFNKKKEELQGAAPLIANANLSYKYSWAKSKNSITSTLSYNYTSDHLSLIGYSSIGRQINKEVHNLDFVIKSNFKKFSVNFSAKNLLNHDIEQVQENQTKNWTINNYNKGTKFSIGLSYTF